MVSDRTFIHVYSSELDVFFCTKVKTICQGQGQISSSYFSVAITMALVFHEHTLLPCKGLKIDLGLISLYCIELFIEDIIKYTRALSKEKLQFDLDVQHLFLTTIPK